MGRRVTVKCTECGATHRVLKNRLGQERPCPKCGITFVLDVESNQSTYDLNARQSFPDEGRAAQPAVQRSAEPDEGNDRPVLSRGTYGQSRRGRPREAGSSGQGLNVPLLVIGGLVVAVLLGLGVHFLTGTGVEPPTPPPSQPAS